MNNEWNLDKIYSGYNSKEYLSDKEKFKNLISEFQKYDFSVRGSKEVFKNALKLLLDIKDLEFNLSFFELKLSANSEDLESLKEMGSIMSISEGYSMPQVLLQKYLIDYPNFMDDVRNDEYLIKFEHYLKKMSDYAKRLLNDETEVMMTKLNKSGGSAWERMFDTLTSTVEVDYEGNKITLSEVRNLAYSLDEETRRKAYFAELESYKKIDKTIAQALSSIKQQTLVIAKARGYEEAIDETLTNSCMTKKTLDALLSSIDDYLPYFRKYLRRKASLMGYENGLPFFNLFAPMGKSDKKFSVEEANEYLISNFKKFNPEISEMMEKAMSNDWIDYFPRKGKVGGAFCAPVFSIKESRILSNFDGTFGDVITLAHELGHAFHNEQLWDEPMTSSDYPMQLAETASTFNETYIKDYAMKNAQSKDELLFILENSIADDTQVIVDCISRYYFEKSVFENVKESALTPKELCDLMYKAQERTYGDGLDKEFYHPYMWACKGHYYSTNLSYYNFPYAFGQLFAYGLYSIYEEKGDSFFELYKDILKNAGKMPIRECALKAGIDVETKEFWCKSLDLIKNKIEKFLEITK